MKISTKNFGEVNFNEEQVITFNEGIPGFKTLKKYIVIEDKESPLSYLQGIDEDVSFIIINPYILKEDYVIDIKDQYVEMLGGGPAEKFSVYVIANVVEDFESATVNLIAPIIIQNETRHGMQVILENSKYTTKHNIKQLLKEGGH